MKIAFLLLSSLLAAAALLAGCVPVLIGAAGGMAATTIEDRRRTGVQIDDEGIELRAGNRIGERYSDQVHVNSTSYNHNLLLTGEVPDAKTKEDIEKIARAVPGVRGVSNELEIAGISSLGARTNDSYLTSKVKASFIDAGKFSAVHVKVVTENGVVYLLGIVTEQEANDAVELARTVAGVRKVVKIFEYCKSGDEVCPAPAKMQVAPQKPPAT
ncbi:MAG TPA: BON domain-containing protein [Burkholderiales bacterium]